MESLRKEARETLDRDETNLPQSLDIARQAAKQISVQDVWADLSTLDNSNLRNLNESLYVTLQFLRGYVDDLSASDEGSEGLEAGETKAVNQLLEWASEAALPSIEFEPIFNSDLDNTEEAQVAQKESRLKGELATSLIKLIATALQVDLSKSPKSVLALVCYTSKSDPWTTDKAADNAQVLKLRKEPLPWSTVDEILRENIRPLFKNSKNPSITSQGRKNFHPIPLSRFEGLSLDESNKPWKNTNIYATRILSWIIEHYQGNERSQMEAHFPLLVPVILTLIDDNNATFKAQGCDILSQVLKSIRHYSSKILARMNLVSVFEEALVACLLSIPTITPEPISLLLLGSAYPALFSLFQTGYQSTEGNEINGSHRPQEADKKDQVTYTKSIQKILRANLISSFHHISSSTPASKETSASFPFPSLSTFLMHWIGVSIYELGFNSIVLLQDIVPVLYTTLSNPFGTAHPPLLAEAVSTTKQLILNAHARIHRWRGEILGGLISCYLHVLDELEELRNQKSKNERRIDEFKEIERNLKITAMALKYALCNSTATSTANDEASVKKAERESEEIIGKEFQELVDADSRLKELLCVKDEDDLKK